MIGWEERCMNMMSGKTLKENGHCLILIENGTTSSTLYCSPYLFCNIFNTDLGVLYLLLEQVLANRTVFSQ